VGKDPLSLNWRIEKKQLLDLLARQSVELSLYQQQLCFNLSDTTTHKDQADLISQKIPNSSLHPSNFDFLHPLLLAYDSRVHTLQSIIDTSSKELTTISSQSHLITTQNKKLRKELESKSIQLTNLYKSPSSGLSTSQTLLEIEKRCLETRLKDLETELVL
jgi:hypothetical protein